MASGAVQGITAVNTGNFAEGIEKLTKALTERDAPLWLLERSKGYVRTNQPDLALKDAERALQVAFVRGNRDFMIQAQIRRAIALFRMDRFADADICAFWAIRLVDQVKANDDEGQQKKVDVAGDYTVRLSDVQGSDMGKSSSLEEGLARAMGTSGRSQETSWKTQALTWRLQALKHLEDSPPGHPGRKVTVTDKFPDTNKPVDLEDKVQAVDGEKKTREPLGEALTSDDNLKGVWQQFCAGHAKNFIRSDWYQSDTAVNVDLFVKNASQDFALKPVERSLVLGPLHDKFIRLYPYRKIDYEESKITVKSMKIELVLRKETPGKWPTLQHEKAAPFSNLTLAGPTLNQFCSMLKMSKITSLKNLPDYDADPNHWYYTLMSQLENGLNCAAALSPIEKSASDPAAKATLTSNDADSAHVGQRPHAYPTSSKKPLKEVNWDKVADLDHDADNDSENGNDVNSFFQKLYSSADPDTRRAMMKSYLESGGTSLSTNWDEAKNKEYTPQPPDGTEVKKWDA